MFPSGGYFRSIDCPFFIHGLCHRPYCHFRHSKPGSGSAKVSILKKLVKGGATEQGEHSKTGDATSEVKISFYSQNDKDESPTKSNNLAPIPKSILKTSTNQDSSYGSEKQQNGNKKLPVYVPSSAAYTVAVKGHAEASVKLENNTKSGDVNKDAVDDDDDVEITDLTEEEKNIVFSGVSKSVGKSNSSCGANQQTSLKIGLEDVSGKSTDHCFASNITNVPRTPTDSLTSKADGATKGAVHHTSQVNMENQSSQPAKHGNNDISGVETLGNESDIISHDKDQTLLSGREEKGNGVRRLFRKEKRRGSAMPTCAESEQYVTKKKKSMLKSEADDTSSATRKLNPVEKEKSRKEIKGNKSTVSHSEAKPKVMNKEIGVSDIDFFSVPSTSSSSKESKDLKCKAGSPSKNPKQVMRGKSLVQSNKKVDHSGKRESNDKHRAEAGIHVSRRKSNVKDCGPKQKKLKADAIKILSEEDIQPVNGDETPVISVSDSDDETSDSPEEAELKRIFDAYQPQQSLKQSSEPVTVQCYETPRERPSSSSAVTPKKGDSMVDKLGLGKKKRVAHDSSYLPRRISLNANPIRRYPKLGTAVHHTGSPQGTSPGPSTSRPISSPSTSAGGMVTASHKPVKRRIAHTPKAPANKAALPRPQIVVEYGAKVPRNQRQLYLERIIDEYLRLCISQEEAYKKAFEEEKAMYERATRRQVYVNLCINLIKKLRNEPSLENSAAVTGLTTVAREPEGNRTETTTRPRKSSEDAASTSASAELTEDSLYESLTKYILNEDELVENGFPRPSPTNPGTAVIKRRKPKRTMKDPSRRTCARCGKSFVIVDGQYQRREQCVYHYGRLWRRRSAGEVVASFSCCQGDAGSTGCCVDELHVSESVGDDDGFMTTITSPLAGKGKKVFGLDCEMCYTTAGLELTRATVVDWKLEKVYDTFVKPDRPIVDYNTRFSGVTEESLKDVTTSLREVQAVLLSIVHKGSILVGHSLESDLTTVKLIHSNIVDTSVVFPHRMGPPYKRALRTLMGEYLKKIIQASVGGHDSFEDAAAALELMRWKVTEDSKVGKRRGSKSSI